MSLGRTASLSTIGTAFLLLCGLWDNSGMSSPVTGSVLPPRCHFALYRWWCTPTPDHRGEFCPRSWNWRCFDCESTFRISPLFLPSAHGSGNCVLHSFWSLQILLKEYNFDNRHKPTFTEEDILNIFPVVKHVNPKASDAFHFFQSGQAKVQQGTDPTCLCLSGCH